MVKRFIIAGFVRVFVKEGVKLDNRDKI